MSWLLIFVFLGQTNIRIIIYVMNNKIDDHGSKIVLLLQRRKCGSERVGWKLSCGTRMWGGGKLCKWTGKYGGEHCSGLESWGLTNKKKERKKTGNLVSNVFTSWFIGKCSSMSHHIAFSKFLPKNSEGGKTMFRKWKEACALLLPSDTTSLYLCVITRMDPLE